MFVGGTSVYIIIPFNEKYTLKVNNCIQAAKLLPIKIQFCAKTIAVDKNYALKIEEYILSCQTVVKLFLFGEKWPR